MTTIIVQLNYPTSRDVTVPIDISGTATYGLSEDYTMVPLNSVWIQAGYKYVSIAVMINNDPTDEYDETVIVTMDTPTNAVLGSPTVHTLTILDNDEPPEVYFTTASQEVSEAVGVMQATLELSLASGKVITVPFSVDGTATGGGIDYSIDEFQVIIPAGATSANINVSIVDDSIDEYDETLILTLNTPENATLGSPSEHTATILDNDGPPDVMFSSDKSFLPEGFGKKVINVELSQVSGKAVVISFSLSGTATNGSDYEGATSQITINPGSLSGKFEIYILDDTIYEGDETVVVSFSKLVHANAGSPNQHTITITDNDDPPVISFSQASQQVSESDGSLSVTIQVSGETDKVIQVSLNVSGTAVEGSDFTLSSHSVSIQPGETSASISINILDDDEVEAEETIEIALSDPTNAVLGSPSTHTITIRDNDFNDDG